MKGIERLRTYFEVEAEKKDRRLHLKYRTDKVEVVRLHCVHVCMAVEE